MLWFPLHAPEKVGTAEESFFLLNIFICKFGDLFLLHSRLLALYTQHPTVNQPWWGGATAKTIKIFRHGGFQVDTDG
jgi:hypothetical protein